MKLSLHPYRLKFKHPFRIAHGLRTHTDVVYVEIEHEGLTGWGEAALPPYLSETPESVIQFIQNFEKKNSSQNLDDWFEKLNALQSPILPAKAALDMALWHLKAQIHKTTVGHLLGITTNKFPQGTYTIGVCTLDEMKEKIAEANAIGFEIFKLKLDGENDDEIISNFKSMSNKPFAVDVNQGWKSAQEAIDKIKWLSGAGCFAVEQPLSKSAIDEMKIVKQQSLLPLYADESCQTIDDLERLEGVFDGVNIKLMKCGGLTEALKMIHAAKAMGFKILIGCMSESSVGCTAAAQLAPLADYADLDGPYLISNDPFTGMKIENGRVAVHPLVQIAPL